MEASAAALPVEVGDRVVDRDRVRLMVKLYVVASTIFFAVAGLLGVIMRESQAGLITIDPNWFYAIMTAHGLGAFVAWAAFAVMGVSFWVLEEVGFTMRRHGYLLAWTAWWTMVIGVVGIVFTTVVMQFGASWVFLYPLPFFPAGQWSDTATGIFSFSVLLVGVSIIAWCVAIVHTCVGPGLQSEKTGILSRTGAALGFGYFAPKRFPTARKLPYPVIPLMVIGIDMVIATLPLAALLVMMIAQSVDSSVTVDPLLAKNMLWFFGHPVVYLLLFPAVAIFYHLIPRFAKRELVAGNIVAFAWLIAVIVNVLVWAHHIYLDYPDDSIQAQLNLAMQPLTFAIVAPSAISLYSLSATIWRSNFEWTPAAKFLAAALIGWLTAGLSGIVNATIAFDEVIHNTMWIVGHFHHMALLNIGMVVFGAVYAFLPKLSGNEWYSDKLGNTHMWLTVIGGYGMITPMLIQGLQGAPRRYAVLPEQYDALSQVTMPFVVITAIGQLVFAYNLVRTLRGDQRKSNETVMNSFALGGASVLAAIVLTISAFAADTGGKRQVEGGRAVTAPGERAASLFAGKCGSCHTLAASNSTGTVGPDLDTLKPDARRVLSAIQKGGAGSGAMPKDIVVGDQASQLAAFVAENAGN
ncbi:MAG: cbb3-type cytochrome c oxidase subunit I [Solirubrobacterales bacterium]